MKIAFLNIYQGKVERGAETFVTELSKRLSKNNQVELIFGSIMPPERKRNIYWRLYLDSNSLAIAWFTLKSLGKILKNRYDIVVPQNGGWQPALVRIVTWLYGGKMVISGQSGIGWDDRNNLWCFPNAFIALSSKALNWAKKAMPLVKSFYIPNGVDLQHFSPIGAKLVTKLKKPMVLCVGALTEQKRIDLVIKAVAKMDNASLLVVGSGVLESDLCKLGEGLLGERFELIHAHYEDMPQVYRCADVFTLVSKTSESFGNVFIEAMASGLPVVATNDSIRKEIVENAGVLVDPTNIGEYAKALETALKTNWSNKTRIQAEKFSWDMVAKKYEELFKNINS
jgi:glycosyltransferase involved in cell wall biosynthesis